ncbi:queuosine precursor transporter [Pontibacillus yanchengensis]|uniref:Probable queuosine precursor transporter n=1 Tax=Pontibacillus yanchengensis Y32 TaxID=1385514 RepID=A0A0A2TAI3_9BACI|nr:queuosine precursor transporter [Pontibacillus yanchengensis]KGP71418.1 transporter [Pontibacillus yanchengensis Y32]
MLMYLNALFVGLLILSNILGVKLFSVGGFVLPAAVIVYVVTYLVTDVIGEVYGREAASKTVKAGFVTQVVAMLFILVAIALPSAPFFEQQAEFQSILGGSFRVMLASLASYLVSQHTDVAIFHKLKQKHGANKLWLRNNVSTMTSQLLDTVVFISIAFYGTVPMSALLAMIGTQYAFKWMVAIIDTPIAYALVKWGRKEQTNSTTMQPEANSFS